MPYYLAPPALDLPGSVGTDLLAGDEGSLAAFPTNLISVGRNKSRWPRAKYFTESLFSNGPEQGFICRIFPCYYLKLSDKGVKRCSVLLLESLVDNPTDDSDTVFPNQRFITFCTRNAFLASVNSLPTTYDEKLPGQTAFVCLKKAYTGTGPATLNYYANSICSMLQEKSYRRLRRSCNAYTRSIKMSRVTLKLFLVKSRTICHETGYSIFSKISLCQDSCIKTDAAAELYFSQQVASAWRHFSLENGVGSVENSFKDSTFQYKV